MSYVASVCQGFDSQTDSVTTTAINTTGANALFLFLYTTGDLTSVTISDEYANTWTADALSPVGPGGSAYLYVFYAQNALVGSAHTFTATWGVSAYTVTLAAVAFAGRATSGLRYAAGANYQGSNYVTSHPYTALSVTAESGCDMVMFGSEYNEAYNDDTDLAVSGSWSAGALARGDGTYIPCLTGYQNDVAAGSISASWASNYSPDSTYIAALAPALPTQPFTQTQFFSNRIVTQI